MEAAIDSRLGNVLSFSRVVLCRAGIDLIDRRRNILLSNSRHLEFTGTKGAESLALCRHTVLDVKIEVVTRNTIAIGSRRSIYMHYQHTFSLAPYVHVRVWKHAFFLGQQTSPGVEYTDSF
jgi:hypothetical protein